MLSIIYQNRNLYFQMIEDFLKKKITALVLQKKHFIQRDKDLDANKISGYTDSYENMIDNLMGTNKEFEEKYSNILFNKAWSSNCLEVLKAYEEGAKKLDIKGEMFFMGIWNFIDEYIREYNPSKAKYFNPEDDIDEIELEEKIRAAYAVLERNKDRWLYLKEKN